MLQRLFDAIVINVARGAVVDEQALTDAIKGNRIGGLGVDVYSTEPMPQDHPYMTVAGRDNVIFTPHMAWAPIESRKRIQDCTERSIRAFLDGHPINTVNM